MKRSILVFFALTFVFSQAVYSIDAKKNEPAEIYKETDFSNVNNIKPILEKLNGKQVMVTLGNGSTFTGILMNVSSGEFVRIKGAPTSYYDTLVEINKISSISYEARKAK